MKKLFLTAILFVTTFASFAQQRFTSRDWEFIGQQHNAMLEQVYNYVKANPDVLKKDTSEKIKSFMIQQVNKTSASQEVKDMAIVNINTYTKSSGPLSNLYPNAETARHLTATDKKYLDQLYNIIKDDRVLSSDVKRQVEALEKTIDADKTLDNTHLAVLYSATNTAKYSIAYWETNSANWANLTGNSATARGCCGDGVGGADVGGAVGAAVATLVVNAAPGVGQVAYGTAIVSGAAAASIGKAAENLWNYIWD